MLNRETLFSSANTIKTFLNKTADVAGLTLCLSLIYNNQVKSTIGIYATSITSTTMGLISGANERVKKIYLAKKSKFLEDAETLKKINKSLRKENTNILDSDKTKDSTQKIIAKLNSELEEMLSRNLKLRHGYEQFVKYPSSFIDLMMSATNGAYDVLVHFAIPMVLLDDFTNPYIVYPAIALSFLSMCHYTILSIFDSHAFWKSLEKEKINALTEVNEFFMQYDQFLKNKMKDKETSKQLIQLLTLWKTHENKKTEEGGYTLNEELQYVIAP